MRNRIPSVFVLAVTVLLLLPGDGRAQQEAFFVDTVDVELVLIDVFVDGKGGDAVLDLTRDDFRLFEDGKPVEIEQFSVITGAARNRQSTISTTVSSGETFEMDDVEMPPAHVVIYIDNLNLGPVSRKRVFDQLQSVLKANLRPQDLVMVASYGGVVDTLLPFSTDRKELRRVLLDASELQAQAINASLGDDRVLQLIETRHSEEMQGGRRVSGDPCVDLGFIARTHAEQVYGTVLRTASELSVFVKSLAGFPGRKTLLHVSDGIPLIAGLEAYSYAIELCDGTGFSKGVPNAVDTAQMGGNAQYTRWNPKTAWAELTSFNSSDEWTELTADANTYQVSIYAVQAQGLVGNQRARVDRAMTSQETATTATLNEQDPLFLMAEETGGQAILNTNQFEPAFLEMVEDTRRGYQLAFTPPMPGDGKHHKIKVEVDRPGVEVRYRKGYRRKTNDQRIADVVLSSLFHDLQENPLNARLEMAKSAALTKNVFNLTMRVHIPLSGLITVAEGDLQIGQFTVFVGVKDGNGSIMPVGHQTLPFRITAADLQQDPDREYIYEMEIPVRGNEQLVAVAVRDELGGTASYVSKSVQLASEADSG